MTPPDRLAVSVTHADGTVTRWGGDEPGAGEIPRALKFGTTIPGGFKDCSCSLSRRIDIDYPDLQLFDDVRVYGPGNETAWEGRQQQFPRRHGSDFSIDIGAVGWSAHLDDDGSFQEIYVDRDPSHWGDIPLAEKVRLAAGGVDGNGAMSFATSNGALVCAIPNQAFPAAFQAASSWYVGPAGSVVSKIMYLGSVTSVPAGWTNAMNFSASDSLGGAFTGVTPTLDGTLRAIPPSPTRGRYVGIYLVSAATALTPAAGAQVRYSKLGVYGNSGVTTHAISGEPDGIYASDVIADIVARTAPKLTFTTGANGSIQPTTFPIPHLVFMDPTTGSAAILLVNGYHLYDWAIWNDRRFHFRPADPDTATIWEARLSDGAQVNLEGDQAADVYNGVIVRYTDPTGVQRSVGPPGSNTDAQNSALASSDPTNPATRAGLTRWEPIDLSLPTTDAGAIQLGAVRVTEQSLPQRRGQIVLTGNATCVQSGWRNQPLGDRPAWAARAGDYVRIADRPGDTPRKIIETGYDHDPRTNTLSVGTTPFKLEAIIERLNSMIVGVL